MVWPGACASVPWEWPAPGESRCPTDFGRPISAALGKPLCQRVRTEVLSAAREVANLAGLAVAVIEFRAIPVGSYGAIPQRQGWGLQIGTSCDGPSRQQTRDCDTKHKYLSDSWV
jgi:hypothetical protein